MGTFSDNLLLSLLAFGESTANGFDNWGESANFNFSRIDAKLGNKASASLTSGDVTLSASAEASIFLALTGVLSASRTVNISARPGLWAVSNETTGSFEVRLEPDGGTPLALPKGTSIVYSDGVQAVLVTSNAGASFRVHKNGVNQDVDLGGGGGSKLVTFSTKEFDIGSNFDTTTSRLTPPAGKYRLSASIVSRGNTGGPTERMLGIELYKNGVRIAVGYGRSTINSYSDPADAKVSTIVDANGTDYFEIFCTNAFGIGGIQRIVGNSDETWFCGEAI